MDRMIAYCGLACDTCPIHLATLETNSSKQAKMRVQIAEQLSKIYGTTPKPEIVSDCDGCKNSKGDFSQLAPIVGSESVLSIKT